MDIKYSNVNHTMTRSQMIILYSNIKHQSDDLTEGYSISQCQTTMLPAPRWIFDIQISNSTDGLTDRYLIFECHTFF